MTHGVQCVTDAISERFAQQPPKLDMSPILIDSAEERASIFFQGLSGNKMCGFSSWASTSDVDCNAAVKNHPEFIGTRIGQAPQGKFAKVHLLQTFFGSFLW